MSMQVVHSSKLDKFLVDPRVKLWQQDFIIDPILSPLSEDIVSEALGIKKTDIKKWTGYGILCKTCQITVDGDHSILFSNYWDVVQASISFSLLEVAIAINDSIDFAIYLCDSLSYIYEAMPDIRPLRLAEIIKLVQVELERSSLHMDSAIRRHGIQSIAIKIAIDLLNTHVKFLGHLYKLPHPPVLRYDETFKPAVGTSGELRLGSDLI